MMWKVYAILSIIFAAGAALDWKFRTPPHWGYNVVYSFEGGQGRIFIDQPRPIKSSKDVMLIEQYIVDHNKKKGQELGRVFLMSWEPLDTTEAIERP